MSGRAQRVREFWERLTPATLATLEAVYAPEVHFRDPFNDVRGVAALRGILEHMFATLEAPAFHIVDIVEDAGGAVLTWNFEFAVRAWQPRVRRTIHGASHVRFDGEGRVAWHRDYWDAAGELYAQLPVIGALVRFLARRLAG